MGPSSVENDVNRFSPNVTKRERMCNESIEEILVAHDKKKSYDIDYLFIDSIYGSNYVDQANDSSKFSKLDQHNRAHHIIHECLHRQFPNIQASCGSKFGCDYLLYDGNRSERHAFAGMRILSSSLLTTKSVQNFSNDMNIHFCVPSAYAMHGFVRSMNTAGKLALLATTIETLDSPEDHSDSTHFNRTNRVAIVDLALEKVINPSSHLTKKGRMESRKEVGKYLSKIDKHQS